MSGTLAAACSNSSVDAPGQLRVGEISSTTSPDRVVAPASTYVVQAGNIIPASLITGIRSDLPGQIRPRSPKTSTTVRPGVSFSYRRGPD